LLVRGAISETWQESLKAAGLLILNTGNRQWTTRHVLK
jgi:hypothetical protein